MPSHLGELFLGVSFKVKFLGVNKQARNIERELRRRIWKHKVNIDFLIDYIICEFDCIIFYCIFDYISSINNLILTKL